MIIIPGQSGTYRHSRTRVTGLLAESGLIGAKLRLGRVTVKSEWSESRVTAPHAALLTVILPDFENAAPVRMTAAPVACLLGTWRRELTRTVPVDCRWEAARRAPQVLRRSGRTRAACCCGRIAPAR